jgi:hypothetical protein
LNEYWVSKKHTIFLARGFYYLNQCVMKYLGVRLSGRVKTADTRRADSGAKKAPPKRGF